MKYHETEVFKMFKEAFINGQVKSDELYSLIRYGCYNHSENKFYLKEFVYCMGIISESMGHFYTEDERVSFMYHIDLEKYKNDTRDELITNFDNASLGYSDFFDNWFYFAINWSFFEKRRKDI